MGVARKGLEQTVISGVLVGLEANYWRYESFFFSALWKGDCVSAVSAG